MKTFELLRNAVWYNIMSLAINFTKFHKTNLKKAGFMHMVIYQGDHLSGKPGNVREFGTCQGNVRDVVNSQGIVREMSVKKSKCPKTVHY